MQSMKYDETRMFDWLPVHRFDLAPVKPTSVRGTVRPADVATRTYRVTRVLLTRQAGGAGLGNGQARKRSMWRA